MVKSKKPNLRLWNAIICLLFLSLPVAAQPQFVLCLDKPYGDLPIPPRIDNSGIYGISRFSVSSGSFIFTFHDSPLVYELRDGQNPRIVRSHLLAEIQPETALRKVFESGSALHFEGSDGTYRSPDGRSIQCRREGGNYFVLESVNEGSVFTIKIPTEAAPAYVDFIGCSHNLYFTIVEFIACHSPLRVERKVYVFDSLGKIRNVILVPKQKYLSAAQEFDVDEEGNLYHMMSYPSGIKMFKWFDLAVPSKYPVAYPESLLPAMHHNSVVPSAEPVLPPPPGTTELAADRNLALRIGDSYANHIYRCTAANLAPVTLRDPGGDSVRTPAWLVTGANARVAYRWGGFNTLAQYNDGLAAGKFAGDIHTSGTSSYAVGVDCSGFVSRCWQMSYHSSTSSMPSITTQYSSWDSLKPADAIHKVGHVRLFVGRAPNGAFRVVESSGRDWSVSYWSYAPSDLLEYTPRFYNSMFSGSVADVPNLQIARPSENTNVFLQWTCDTANVLGYRLYKSVNGSDWTRLLDENSLKSTSLETSFADSLVFFRVSLVRSVNGVSLESYWSNALSVSLRKQLQKKYLLINGFQRNTGSWRGLSDGFTGRYVKALSQRGAAVASCRNSALGAGIELSHYDCAFWFVGDESTIDETFSSSEQAMLKGFLESGKSLFVCGSEIGYDLFSRGSAEDKAFYSNYFKAQFNADNSGAKSVSGINGNVFPNLTFQFGQVYDEDYPDEIAAYGGSNLCLRYANGKGAGIAYQGNFGASAQAGKLIYLAFPLETTANDTAFSAVISGAVDFFEGTWSDVITAEPGLPSEFVCLPAYPNPFNGQTTVQVFLRERGPVNVTLYNILGSAVYHREFANTTAGKNVFPLVLREYPSGVYFCMIRGTSGSAVQKIELLR